MVNSGSIPLTTTNLKFITMQFILTCPNGKKIDMSSDILKQMSGEIDRTEVNERIEFYKKTNS